MDQSKRLGVVCASLILSAVAGRAPAQDVTTTWGFGNKSCGAWTSAHVSDDSIASLGLDAWLGGFVTAYNVYVSKSGDVGSPPDFDGLTAWVSNYCQAHPVDSVSKAANRLIDYLQTRTAPVKR